MESGSILLSKGRKQKRFLIMLREKGRKGYKVSGNRNLFSGRFCSKSEEMRTWVVVPK